MKKERLIRILSTFVLNAVFIVLLSISFNNNEYKQIVNEVDTYQLWIAGSLLVEFIGSFALYKRDWCVSLDHIFSTKKQDWQECSKFYHVIYYVIHYAFVATGIAFVIVTLN